jgi:XTP/dITP diphosphohydrolase/ATP diphosphatase
MRDGEKNGRVFAEAAAIMARLRGEGGCPWDRDQTFDSVRRYTLEETYEVFDAIERRDWPNLREELGDLLLQVLFYAQMADEAGYFNIADVLETLNAKLIRRHPHVFGELAGTNIQTEGVLANWEEFKRQERAEKSQQGDASQAPSLMDAVPRNLPANVEAQKIGSKAAKVGFDWPDIAGLFAKLEEETAELRRELDATEANKGRIEAEAGDLLFTAVQIARRVDADAEMSLRATNARFRKRFAAMEAAAAAQGKRLEELSADTLEALWQTAKDLEHTP